MQYKFTCTCGDEMTAMADSKEEAVEKFLQMMNQEAVEKHMAEKHPGDPVPDQNQVRQMIQQSVQPAN